MAADLAKCRSGENYHEGNAVSIQPVIVSPSDKIISVSNNGRQNKDWETYFSNVIADRWENIGYYYSEQI